MNGNYFGIISNIGNFCGIIGYGCNGFCYMGVVLIGGFFKVVIKVLFICFGICDLIIWIRRIIIVFVVVIFCYGIRDEIIVINFIGI